MLYLSKIFAIFFVWTISVGLYAKEKTEIDWVSLTLDNDLFVGNDNGYTNGFYATFLDVPDSDRTLPHHDFWVVPLLWSLPNIEISGSINLYSIGQTMLSPSDITIENPPKNELPYSAMIAFSNSFITANARVADRISTSIGIVGPWAFGEETQKFVHEMLGADEPKGWDTQLNNELVFQFLRSRAWRNWSSASDNMDIVTTTEISAGTLSSAAELSASIRFGRGLIQSFPTMLFSSSRLANPLAVDQGWFIYAGVNAGYTFNQIFADGNTFRNSRSIAYDKEFLGMSIGISKATREWAFTFAFVDSNLIENDQDDEALENLTRFGTMTVAWKL